MPLSKVLDSVTNFKRRLVSASWKRVLTGVLVSAGLAGCSANPVYTTTGIVLVNYADAEATPYVLEMTDARMACALGQSLDPLVYSFSRVTSPPDTTGSLLMLLAANCSEYELMEAELDFLRANFEGNSNAARHTREQVKRLNAEVANRRVLAFNRAMSAFDFNSAAEPLECPFLFSDQDELTFMFGLVTGLQAIVNDANSGAAAGVPRSIAPQAERAIRCVDDEKWGGIPNAVRAVVWLLLPDTRPDLSPDPWQVLENSSELGFERGYRVSSALEIVAAETFGRPEVKAKALAKAAEAEKEMEASNRFPLLDAVAKKILLHASDKHWVTEYGYRTPSNQFGSMSPVSQRAPVQTMDLDDLL
ncbi:MAG: hypothetical protein HLUCCX14_07640 [Marinobacter excellens HL-55]|uniref:Uncharacterized protein n=1 Tax=Marinobacter excellens HL-55 TaxID=1305731 RepID=A0A0P7ZAI0_9GAMM|nr:MAG: hypothetical protein HLUCCX14_07640 [Marinobacter excellens HL-55]